MGHILVARRYYHCKACGTSQTPFDAWAGLDRRSLTAGARRMVCLAGTSWSFDKASRHLQEFCHMQVSDDTIERVCQEEAERSGRWMNDSDQPVQAFEKAKGDV